MALGPISSRTGIPESALEELMDGQASSAVAAGLGATRAGVQDFLDGEEAPAVATVLGIPERSLDALTERLDREGRVGFLLGLLWRMGGREGRP